VVGLEEGKALETSLLMSEYFQSSLDLLLAELKRIELKVQLRLLNTRENNNQSEDDNFRGLYISEKQIDTIIHNQQFQQEGKPSWPDNSPIGALTQLLKQYEENLAEKRKESLRHGLILGLDNLKRLFGLSTFDLDTLLVCLLPELDLEYKRIYAYLQDDVTKKSPTVNFVLQLLCNSHADMLKARQAFSPEAPLLKYHLISLHDNHISGPTTLLVKFIHVDERITNYLLETNTIDAHLLSFTNLIHPTLKLQDVILSEKTKLLLTKLVTQYKDKAFICHLYGPYGVGKQTTAEAVCSELGIPLLYVDLNRMVLIDINPELLVPLIFREGILQNAVFYLDGFDLLLRDEREIKPACKAVMKQLESYPHPVFLSGEKNWQPRGELENKAFIDIELSIPSYTERKQIWHQHWNGDPFLAFDADLSDVANKFRFSGGQIRDAIITARNLAQWRDSGNEQVTKQDLYLACRAQSREILSSLAHKIQPKYDWADIILPEDQMEQLREICNYVKYYSTVYNDWGFERKLSLGKGLNILFAGPSGTGKTMAAEIISHELGLDLYKIDLSAIVSKYIGETEKNLDRIFQEGQTSNAILFFDEADALFGKRSEVRDSHDRYANIEISYLLQKMDEYDGIVILATNLRKNIDEGFSRRLHFALEFPIPDETDRYRIWKSIFPPEVPLAKDIDIEFMARQFKITGGNIKNIALGAAFLAVEDGGCINTENLVRATKREYQKMGKLCTIGEFARYFELVKG
jgi:SpoVK/Ycf46/Vps4 family AAA+-type ATPase